MNRKRWLGAIAAVAVLAIVASAAWWLGRTTGTAAGPHATYEAAPARAVPLYHCPMHPTIVSDRPGDCPVCFMDLVPVERDAGSGAEAHGSGVAGLAPVHIPVRKRQLVGVKTAAVARVPLSRTIRAVGRVTYDETRLRHVHTKIAGWVERLHANATGEVVRRGQPLLEIYSPELLATQEEYLVALATRERTSGIDLPSVAGVGDDLVASARRRLELFDVTGDQIAELERTRRARRTSILEAPISGTIVERLVTQGQRIEPGQNLLAIADMSRVWVVASVYEYELPLVRDGQRATVELSYLPGRTFEGEVSLVYPTLDPATRTAAVRIELANPGMELRPDMYAEVRLHADLGERLAVPASAVIDTGERSVAFVDLGQGLFEPRELDIGVRLPELYEVEAGVRAGERVVTSAAFFVDSESKLAAALAAMGAETEAPAADHEHAP
jgi:RND family efflux transporter MFP subunit